jgi:hypothetical protein
MITYDLEYETKAAYSSSEIVRFLNIDDILKINRPRIPDW